MQYVIHQIKVMTNVDIAHIKSKYSNFNTQNLSYLILTVGFALEQFCFFCRQYYSTQKKACNQLHQIERDETLMQILHWNLNFGDSRGQSRIFWRCFDNALIYSKTVLTNSSCPPLELTSNSGVAKGGGHPPQWPSKPFSWKVQMRMR
jgi:hypothetical protein